VFIPGLSNDLDSVASLINELAINGRKVVVIAQPESQMGTVSKEFVEATAKHPDLTAHKEFYKAAINNLVGEDIDVELWGHSIGGELIFEILNDSDFQKRTTNAVVLCPASSANVSGFQMTKALTKEAVRFKISGRLLKVTFLLNIL